MQGVDASVLYVCVYVELAPCPPPAVATKHKLAALRLTGSPNPTQPWFGMGLSRQVHLPIPVLSEMRQMGLLCSEKMLETDT